MEGLTYNIKKEPKCVLNIKCELLWSAVSPKYDKVTENIRANLRLPGFRKGKVPMAVVLERYFEETKYELINKIVPEILSEILEKEDINPVVTPQIRDFSFEKEKNLKVEIKVEVYPEVNLKKYKKLKLDKKEFQVKETDVDKTIASFKENNAMLKEKEGIAVKGNLIMAEISSTFETETLDLGMPEEVPVEIGGEFILKDFDKNLKGLKKGDEKEFSYVFPEDFYKEDLRNKEAQFKVHVKMVKEKIVPEDDKMAESLGLESFAKLRENIRKNLEAQMKQTSDNELEENIIKTLVEKNDLDIPDGLVEEKFNQNMERMSEYIKYQGGDPDQIDAERIKEKTSREVKAGIILSTIAKEENISVTDDDRKEEESKVLNMLGGDSEENRKKVSQYVDDNVILTRKVFDFIKENAKIKVVQEETPSA